MLPLQAEVEQHPVLTLLATSMEPGSDLEFIALQKKSIRGAHAAGGDGAGAAPMVTEDGGAETGEATGDVDGTAAPPSTEAASLPAGQDSSETGDAG